MEESLINDKVGAWLLEPSNTRERLASALDIVPSSLANKLSGKTEWTWHEVRKLASTLGCSVKDFVQ